MASGLHESPFPDITLKEFGDFIKLNFNSTISLSSVLVILFSLTENTQLLSLHGCQQKKRYKEEKSTSATAWIRVLAHSIRQKLEPDDTSILSEDDVTIGMKEQQITIAVAMKLDEMAKMLKLHPMTRVANSLGN